MNVKVSVMEDQAARVRLVAAHRDTPKPPRELDQAVTVLGSGDGADLILASSQVEPSHAAIVRLGNTAYLCDFGAPGGSLLNGRPVRWARLADGDEIGLGPFRFRVELEEVAPFSAGEEPAFSLRNEPTIGVVNSVDPALIVGKDPGCDVVLRDDAVEPRHCLVVWTQEGPIVRDLRRQERTRLNGRQINSGRLISGDAIGVGPFELIFAIAPSGTGVAPEGTQPDGSHFSPEFMDAFDPDGLVAGRLASGRLPELSALWPEAQEDLDFDRPESRSHERPITEAPPPEREPSAASRASDTFQGEEAAFWKAPSAAARAANAPPEETVTMALKGTDDKACLPLHRQGRRPTSPGGFFAEAALEERRRKLDQRIAEVRTRVSAAQDALDRRARKHRERLDGERDRLKSCRNRLQSQAERLLEFARKKHRVAKEDSAAPPGLSADAQAGVPSTAGKAGPQQEGHQPPVWDRLSSRSDPLGGLEPSGLQERVTELAELVKRGRKETERDERKLETLQGDIQRLRGYVARTRERHRTRDEELEARLQGLEETRQALRQERDALLSRVRRLETQEAALAAEIGQAERCRHESERESDRLIEAQEKLDERRRELRTSLEKERQRLRTRQEELQRRTTELAKATREQRCSIEAEVSERQTELDVQEAELKARRAAIEAAGRDALEKTAVELEEVLNVGLGEIESDLKTRQRDLDDRVGALVKDNTSDGEIRSGRLSAVAQAGPGAVLGSPGGTDEACRPGSGRRADPPATSGGRLETLLGEIEAVHNALASMDDDGDGNASLFADTGDHRCGTGFRAGQGLEDRLDRPGGRPCCPSPAGKPVPQGESASLRGIPQRTNPRDDAGRTLADKPPVAPGVPQRTNPRDDAGRTLADKPPVAPGPTVLQATDRVCRQAGPATDLEEDEVRLEDP